MRDCARMRAWWAEGDDGAREEQRGTENQRAPLGKTTCKIDARPFYFVARGPRVQCKRRGNRREFRQPGFYAEKNGQARRKREKYRAPELIILRDAADVFFISRRRQPTALHRAILWSNVSPANPRASWSFVHANGWFFFIVRNFFR